MVVVKQLLLKTELLWLLFVAKKGVIMRDTDYQMRDHPEQRDPKLHLASKISRKITNLSNETYGTDVNCMLISDLFSLDWGEAKINAKFQRHVESIDAKILEEMEMSGVSDRERRILKRAHKIAVKTLSLISLYRERYVLDENPAAAFTRV